MMIELSPTAYTVLCGLVMDNMMTDSDAAPLLRRVAQELGAIASGGMIPSELVEDPTRLEALRRAGFVAR
ncbi:MAG: hypothetical protein ABTQ34_08655 [Bdellovibrionales bacterium]